jgi:hypothetical protein
MYMCRITEHKPSCETASIRIERTPGWSFRKSFGYSPVLRQEASGIAPRTIPPTIFKFYGTVHCTLNIPCRINCLKTNDIQTLHPNGETVCLGINQLLRLFKKELIILCAI